MKTKFKAVLTAALAAAVLMTGCGKKSSDEDGGESINRSDSSQTTTINDASLDEYGREVLATGFIGDTSNGGKPEDVSWTVYQIEDECNLEIRGYGKHARMRDFKGTVDDRPEYYEYNDKIRKIQVRFTENIGDFAFCNCYNAREVSTTDDITEIGKYAFKECRSLGFAALSENTKKLGDNAFLNCVSLVRITSKIERGKDLSDAKAYSFTENLTDIGEKAFDACGNLVIHCKDGTKIADYAKQNKYKYEIVK